jgi:hypothetical protein
VRFLTLLKCRIITGWMSAMMVLSSANKKVELRMDRTTTAYFQPVMSRGGSSLAVSVRCLDFSGSTSVVEEFLETSRVSLLGVAGKLSFDPASTSFSLRVFPAVEPTELI